jgi:hypothetical protein
MDFWKAAARPSGTRTLNPVNSLRIDRAPVPPSPKASMTGKNCERGARARHGHGLPRELIVLLASRPHSSAA